MEKKHRNEELNFLYLDMEDTSEKEKKKVRPKKVNYKGKKTKRADRKKSAPIEDDKFNFDNEIVIGVTRIPDPKQKNSKTNTKTRKTDNKKTTIRQEKKKPPIYTKKGQAKPKEQEPEEQQPKEKKKWVKAIKWIVLVIAIGVAIILFLLSPVFNIASIQVENNSKINAETYISLSQIQIGENTFKINKNKVIKSIKENPYVESVKVVRKLPDIIQIQVEERKAKFAIEYASSYLYINSQGYLLEIVEQNSENLPMIRSIQTPEEELKVGNRLREEDLEKLGSVLKIIEAANGVSIGQYITYIDIANKHNYILRLEEKKKSIYLGDDSNLSHKMLYSKAIIEKEEGVEGNIQAADAEKGNVVFQFKE